MRGLTRQLVLWTVLSVPLGAVSEARVTVDLPLASSGPSSVKSAAESSDYSSASLRINRGRHAASLLFFRSGASAHFTSQSGYSQISRSTGLMPVALPLAVPAAEGQKRLPSLADMLERTNPTVVNIATHTTVMEYNRLLEDPFFRRFFDVPKGYKRYRRTQSAGSGVVIDAARGYIVTNNHVVDRADEINVGLADGRTLIAQLIGRDPQVDLALLQVDPDGLQAITFANSRALRVGDFVVAIGNPFGLKQTVTSGIVSALGRTGLGIEGYEDFIQTDAPINPGNSGGALVDLNGRLVGINTAIFAPNGGNVGIGFAIPANMVKAVTAELIAHGEVRRGYIGIVAQPLNRELAAAFGVLSKNGPPQGVVVVDVGLGSAAEHAGMEIGDVLVRIGDSRVRSVADFDSQAATLFVGDEVAVELIRQGETLQKTLRITADPLQQINGERVSKRLRGVTLQNIRAVDGPNGEAGVLVLTVEPNSDVAGFGLRVGDIIVAANRYVVDSVNALREGARMDSRQLLLRIYRNGRYGYIPLR